MRAPHGARKRSRRHLGLCRPTLSAWAVFSVELFRSSGQTGQKATQRVRRVREVARVVTPTRRENAEIHRGFCPSEVRARGVERTLNSKATALSFRLTVATFAPRERIERSGSKPRHGAAPRGSRRARVARTAPTCYGRRKGRGAGGGGGGGLRTWGAGLGGGGAGLCVTAVAGFVTGAGAGACAGGAATTGRGAAGGTSSADLDGAPTESAAAGAFSAGSMFSGSTGGVSTRDGDAVEVGAPACSPDAEPDGPGSGEANGFEKSTAVIDGVPPSTSPNGPPTSVALRCARNA